ncbi:DUF6376 family protein [Paenibacillus glycanilyticus]|uniref:DUF6376 family protein n=1 Tax=Paenibacillus glycanilyticus TaxID=126569 RepID=UPI0019112074|nr:DUF6376 family protein [Paenibacillus glycanilyticus]
MRTLMIILLVVSSMMLSACTWFESANQTVQYADSTHEHINRLTDFAEQAPQMIQDAATNPETKQQLEERLVALKEDIEQFNLMDAPAMAKDLHQQIIEKNQVLLQEINDALVNGHLALDQLQSSPILQTITDITGLLNRIENLGL